MLPAWTPIEVIHKAPFYARRALGDVFSQKIEGAKHINAKHALMTSLYGAAFIGGAPAYRSSLESQTCKRCLFPACQLSPQASSTSPKKSVQWTPLA